MLGGLYAENKAKRPVIVVAVVAVATVAVVAKKRKNKTTGVKNLRPSFYFSVGIENCLLLFEKWNII